MSAAFAVAAIVLLTGSAASAGLSSCQREHGDRSAAGDYAVLTVVLLGVSVCCGLAAWSGR